MFFKVQMVAEECDEAIVELNESEYEAVKKFLKQVGSQNSVYSWVCGHWQISRPCNTEQEARELGAVKDFPIL